MANVPARISVRLGDDLRARIGEFAEQHGMSGSQAIRMVLENGSRPDQLPGDEHWRRAAFREGINEGLAEFKKTIMGALSGLWSDR